MPITKDIAREPVLLCHWQEAYIYHLQYQASSHHQVPEHVPEENMLGNVIRSSTLSLLSEKH